MKNTNIAVKDISADNIFKWWLELTKPFHKLSKPHTTVIEALLHEHYYLRHNIKDQSLVNDVLFSTSSRKRIMDRTGMSVGVLNNNLTQLRNNKCIIDNKINPKLIPNIDVNATDFRIIFQFKING